MNEHLPRNARPTQWTHALGAAGLALALGACAHSGTDDVKPTDTTAYRSGGPAAPSTPVAPPEKTRE